MKIRTFTAGEFAENGYVATAGDGTTSVVIDPGAAADQMLETIEAGELRVEAILLTHSHLDHVEGVVDIHDRTGAPLHLHPADRPLYDQLPEQARRFGMRLRTPPPPDRELEHGQSLEFGDMVLQVRHAPGHAPGHVIFWEEAAGEAFVGDVVFQGSIGRTDLPGGDFRSLMESIREQVLTLPEETRLLPGHGPATTVGAEREGNPFLIAHYGGELA